MENNATNKSLEQRRFILAQQIVDGAIVVDAAGGYILCKEVNHKVNFSILREAAFLTQKLFLNKIPIEDRPKKVIGIPNRGKEFALALGLANDSYLIDGPVTERVQEKANGHESEPKAHYDALKDLLTITGIPSFTKKGKVFTHTIRGLRPGDSVLIADDFAATGTVSEIYFNALTSKDIGIKPYFTFLIAKDFTDLNPPQIGFRQLSEKAPAFAVVRFTRIEGKKVIAEIN